MSLFDRSEVVPIRTQKIPQGIETPVSFVAVPGAYVRYAYSRSGDSMAHSIEGQDYLCFQHNDQRLVFVVCDGVGSSFCGNLAARILGDGLLEWLWALDITYLGGAAALMEAATSFLNRLQKQARHEVEEYKIPDQISPLVRQALEAQRAYGSESVFVAMRIDHPGPTIPDGLISLCWMGDSQMHVFDELGGEIPIGGTWDNANRWSTTQGARGQMSTSMRDLAGVGRIVAFSDGLAAHASKLITYSDDVLDREIRAGARLSTSDDVSLIDVVLRTPLYEGYPDPALPDPGLERPVLEPIWNPTGAPTYELRWSWPARSDASFMIQEATHPALTDAQVMNAIAKEPSWKPDKPQPPGHYYYRVRAVSKRGGLTPWSELRQTRVAYPPPPAPRLLPVEPFEAPTLAWEIEGQSLDFTLVRAAAPDFDEPVVMYSGRASSWSLPAGSLPPGAYYFRVQATSDGGPGPWSDPLEVRIVLPPPPRPSLAAASYLAGGQYDRYELRWQAVPGATHYELEEAREGGETRLLTTSDTAYRAIDQPEGRYTYRVRACHATACSEWSNEQAVAIAARPPEDAPTLSMSGPDEAGLIRLTWPAVTSAEGYEIEVSEDESFHSARVYTTDAPGLELTRREPGRMCARARGANGGGPGPWSEPLRFDFAPPVPEWIETAPGAGGSLSVAWGSAGGGRVAYRLEGGRPGQEDSFSTVYVGGETHFEAHTPAGATEIVFRVRAEAGSVCSAWQTGAPVRGAEALAAPTLRLLQDDPDGDIRLEWSAIAGAAGYQIEASRQETFEAATRQQTGGTSAVFHAPSSGKYWVRVRARLGDLSGAPSNIVQVAVRRPSAPRMWPLDTVKENTLFEISWTGVPGCAYYELEGSTNSRFEAEKPVRVSINHPSQKYTVPGRKAGTYYYRVRAVDEQGQPSAWSQTLTVQVGSA